VKTSSSSFIYQQRAPLKKNNSVKEQLQSFLSEPLTGMMIEHFPNEIAFLKRFPFEGDVKQHTTTQVNTINTHTEEKAAQVPHKMPSVVKSISPENALNQLATSLGVINDLKGLGLFTLGASGLSLIKYNQDNKEKQYQETTSNLMSDNNSSIAAAKTLPTLQNSNVFGLFKRQIATDKELTQSLVSRIQVDADLQKKTLPATENLDKTTTPLLFSPIIASTLKSLENQNEKIRRKRLTYYKKLLFNWKNQWNHKWVSPWAISRFQEWLNSQDNNPIRLILKRFPLIKLFNKINLYRGIDLRKNYLDNANFTRCKLINVNFLNTDLTQAKFFYSTLDNSCFYGVQMPKALIARSSFKNTDFRHSNLIQSNLSSSDFENSDFLQAHLNKAKLQGASFKNANLHNADLSWANLDDLTEETNDGNRLPTETKITWRQLKSAHIDPTTSLPKRLFKEKESIGMDWYWAKEASIRPDEYTWYMKNADRRYYLHCKLNEFYRKLDPNGVLTNHDMCEKNLLEKAEKVRLTPTVQTAPKKPSSPARSPNQKNEQSPKKQDFATVPFFIAPPTQWFIEDNSFLPS
jgi:uncharacterized protein YjbI with pentapeptide repeats